jgi:hypothetical protein
MACREVTALPPLLLWWALVGGDVVPLFYRTHPLVSGLQIVESRFFKPYFSRIFLNVYFFVLRELPHTEIKIGCLFHPRSLLFSFQGRSAGCVQTRNSHYLNGTGLASPIHILRTSMTEFNSSKLDNFDGNFSGRSHGLHQTCPAAFGCQQMFIDDRLRGAQQSWRAVRQASKSRCAI